MTKEEKEKKNMRTMNYNETKYVVNDIIPKITKEVENLVSNTIKLKMARLFGVFDTFPDSVFNFIIDSEIGGLIIFEDISHAYLKFILTLAGVFKGLDDTGRGQIGNEIRRPDFPVNFAMCVKENALKVIIDLDNIKTFNDLIAFFGKINSKVYYED